MFREPLAQSVKRAIASGSCSGSKPKVLLVGAFPQSGKVIFGGIATACEALMSSTLPQKLDLDLLDSLQISNPPPPFVRRLLLAGKRLGLFTWRLFAGRPHVVLLFTSAGASLIEKGTMAWIAKLAGRPAMLFPRGSLIVNQFHASWLHRVIIATAFKGARAVLCQGDRARCFAVEQLGFAPEDARVIQNWTAHPGLIARGRARPSAQGRARRIIYVGWLEDHKGVLQLIEAFARLEHAELMLDMVGDGNAMGRAQNLAVRLNVADRVVFHGWKRREERDALLEQADIFALASWWEGLPNAMIEAMATRLPPVVTRVGTIDSFIADGRNGFLIEPRNVEKLSARLDLLVKDAKLRRRMADAAFETAVREFSVEPAVDKIVDAVFHYAGKAP